MRQSKLKTYRLLFLFLLVSGAGTLWGQVKETRVDQSFNVNSNTRLSIENRFGKVHIDTWNQNQIKAMVVVEVEGSESAAREVLDRIRIDVSESAGEVRIETDIEESNSNRWNNSRFKIDYTISMPKGNPLSIEHRHGDIYINNFDGPLDVDLAHGQIITEELKGRSQISLQHGNGGRIAAIGSGTLEIQHYQRLRIGKLGDLEFEIAHASAEIESAGDLEMEVMHSNLEFGSIGNLNLEMQHSKLEAGPVASLTSDMQHSTIHIERLDRVLNADCQHSQVEVDRMSADFEEIIFDGNHSYLSVELDAGANGSIEVDLNHGRLNYSESRVSMSYVNVENNSRHYQGKIGNGTGGKIQVDGNFTDVSLEIN